MDTAPIRFQEAQNWGVDDLGRHADEADQPGWIDLCGHATVAGAGEDAPMIEIDVIIDYFVDHNDVELSVLLAKAIAHPE